MPHPTCSVPAEAATPNRRRHGRSQQVAHLHAWRQAGQSQRAYARHVGLPRTTLRDWAATRQDEGLDPQLAHFFDSPAGLALLQRLFVAALLVMNLQGNCGLRRVSQFFELSGLSSFLASSYGLLQQHSATLHGLVADFGQQQGQELGRSMPHKRIVVCEDETFPASGMTLLAMEPGSGFLLAEQTAEDRTAATWNAVLDQSLAPYNVSVLAQCSDEASALLRHAQEQGLRHRPDLFHVLQDINGALVLHLARWQAQGQGDGPGLPQVQAWQKTRQDAVAALSESYHPYDLRTAEAQDMASVLSRMDEALCTLEQVAQQSRAPSSSVRLLAKARRTVPAMVIAVADYHVQLQQSLQVFELPEAVQQHLEEVLLPAAYLRRMATAAPTAAERQRRLQRAEQLEQQRPWPHPPLAEEERQALSLWVQQCVGEFCRGTSCVEGRNGVLSLRQHAHRRLLPSKRAALTVAHNFLSRRQDGSTAAQRFFEQSHPDLFGWLLARMPVPPRPAASRAKRVRRTPALA